jgi:SAM-dependent methyltransferase
MTSYAFDSTTSDELARLRALQTMFDPATMTHLTQLGVGPGWRCLELGAGAGSVAEWLADRVGDTGQVVATDLKPQWLAGRPNLEVRQHDITTDPLEAGAYDLVHARALLEHLPQRLDVLGRLIAALKPGGRLLVEDLDFGDDVMLSALSRYSYPVAGGDGVVFDRVLRGISSLLCAIGADMGFGTRLPVLLQEAGLTEVGAVVRSYLGPGGTDSVTWRSVEYVREQLVTHGLCTEQEVDRFLTLAHQPGTFHLSPAVVSVWGCRPAS